MTATFNKSDLIAEIANATGQSRDHVDMMVSQILGGIARRALEGRVALKGFGVFEMRERAPRNGRNPATGEPMQIAGTRRLAFRASRSI